MPTIRKTGEKISWKEAFKRFKIGVDNITPIQKLENDVRGTFITLLGYVFAMGAVIWKFNTIGLLSVGLILIFLGSIVTTGLKWIALRQQLKFIKNLDYESDDDSQQNKQLTVLDGKSNVSISASSSADTNIKEKEGKR